MGSESQERVILTPKDPLEWWRNEYTRRPLTGLVFERGDWCTLCRHDVNQWREQLPRLEALGGTFFIVTAQEREAVQNSASNWGLDGVPIVSDPGNVLAREMGLVVSMTPVRPGIQCYFDTYKNGVCSPGYVIVNQQGAEIAGWRQQPSVHNIGGAIDRPIPVHVMNYVENQVQTDPGAPAVADPNEVLDDFSQYLEEVFYELPECIQELLLEEKRFSLEADRLAAPAGSGICV